MTLSLFPHPPDCKKMNPSINTEIINLASLLAFFFLKVLSRLWNRQMWVDSSTCSNGTFCEWIIHFHINCELHTNRPLGLISKRLSLFYVFERIHASQISLLFYFSRIFPLQWSLSSQDPYRIIRSKRTDSLYHLQRPSCVELTGYKDTRSIRRMPEDMATLSQSQSSAENSTCGTLGSHSCCSPLTFFLQGSLRKQYRSDGSLQTVCDGMSEAIKEIFEGFKRQPKSGQGGISSGPNDMDTLWRASSKPDRNASLAVWIPCGFKGSPWGDVLSVG